MQKLRNLIVNIPGEQKRKFKSDTCHIHVLHKSQDTIVFT